jgi:hypothetical protein
MQYCVLKSIGAGKRRFTLVVTGMFRPDVFAQRIEAASRRGANHWPLALLAWMWVAGSVQAEVKLPALFSDHMVLQRGVAVPVWGWASPGEPVTVAIAGQTQTATANAGGRWRVTLDALNATEPVTLTVKGENTLTVNDVLVGEVWLASGQSNMQLPVNDVSNAPAEKAAANYPGLRMFTVARHPAAQPQENCQGQWVVCRPETVGNFSATAYFFGRDLQQDLKTPVGLINASWGATPIETWTSLKVQQEHPELDPIFAFWRGKMRVPFDAAAAQAQHERQLAAWKVQAQKARAAGHQPPPAPVMAVDPRLDKNHPANLFNGMIAPLIPYALRGAIWYQGENNASHDFASLYALQLPLLIRDWRARWGEGDFPFAWVQLPNYKPRTEDPGAPSNWAVVREAMRKSLALPNTGMAVIIDAGEAKNIHPKDKQIVGQRLALWARAEVYGEPIPHAGPLLAGHEIRGNEVMLSFTHTDGGLVARGGDLKGFAIAGADRQWRWAQARIAGDRVIVSHPDVKVPVAVRYAWADNPDCNLYNGAGLPASPFTTDDAK